MSDLISREQAIEKVKAFKIFAPTDGVEKTLNAVMDAIVHSIAVLPATVVQKVRRGEWQKNEQYVFICSICGCEAYCDEFGEQELSTYCPDCGALMEGE